MSLRINIGCGMSTTSGWKNYDNSWGIRLSAKPVLSGIVSSLGLLSDQQKEYMDFARREDINWANATTHIPEQAGSVSALYSSHMLEHLEKNDALTFLKEAHRVLATGGVIRISVPDLMHHIQQYLDDRDADGFIDKMHVTRPKPRSLMAKLKYSVVGDRHHQWMYDGDSLCKLLKQAGFPNPAIMQPGETKIADSGDLDLFERADESVYVEAVKE